VRQVGPYRLLEPLGAGGMGTVYRALHTHLGKVVALKLLRSSWRDVPEAVGRFRREMRAAGRLRHPNLVEAYDAGAEGVPYLAMELVAGLDVARLLQGHPGGRLAVADACEVVRQAAAGLQHAFENGLVHRDLKPSNLLLTPDGTVKVLDLGLALPRSATPGQADLTGAGQFLGTPDYMAPEQLLDPHTVDVRADLYSLGATLYHLLAGRPPFDGPGQRDPAGKRRAHLQ
jgi:serine/threonine protein kinase